MTEAMAPAGTRAGDGPAAFLLYAMWLRQIQLGRAVQELCIHGFAQEAQMLSRAVVGAALDMMLICEQDVDRRVLLYAMFQKKVRRERSKALVRHGHLSRQAALELEQIEQEIDRQALSAHALAGTRPAPRLGQGKDDVERSIDCQPGATIQPPRVVRPFLFTVFRYGSRERRSDR